MKLLMKTANTPSQRPRCTENLGGLGCFVLVYNVALIVTVSRAVPSRFFPFMKRILDALVTHI